MRFTEITIGGTGGALLLGPLAVAADVTRQGFGRALIAERMEAAKSAGVHLVVLVGDEPYYGRFGFPPRTAGPDHPAGTCRSPDACLLLRFSRGALANYTGLRRFAFAGPFAGDRICQSRRVSFSGIAPQRRVEHWTDGPCSTGGGTLLAAAAAHAQGFPGARKVVGPTTADDQKRFMQLAINQAKNGDYPFGAIIVREGKVLALGQKNSTKRDSDPTAHAEMMAIHSFLRGHEPEAISRRPRSIASGEPCPMCMGAVVWYDFKRLVYAASIAAAIATQDRADRHHRPSEIANATSFVELSKWPAACMSAPKRWTVFPPRRHSAYDLTSSVPAAELLCARRVYRTGNDTEFKKMRSVLLWLIGVPISVIILMNIFHVI